MNWREIWDRMIWRPAVPLSVFTNSDDWNCLAEIREATHFGEYTGIARRQMKRVEKEQAQLQAERDAGLRYDPWK